VCTSKRALECRQSSGRSTVVSLSVNMLLSIQMRLAMQFGSMGGGIS